MLLLKPFLTRRIPLVSSNSRSAGSLLRQNLERNTYVRKIVGGPKAAATRQLPEASARRAAPSQPRRDTREASSRAAPAACSLATYRQSLREPPIPAWSGEPASPELPSIHRGSRCASSTSFARPCCRSS